MLFATWLCIPGILNAVETAPSVASSSSKTQSNSQPPAQKQAQPQTQAQGQPQNQPTMYIREYRVLGAHKISNEEVEEAVYPFLGPARTRDDVEKARAALEKAYQAKGFQSVSVEVPLQEPKGGVITLQVNEMTVGRLRVHGARYFSPNQIKEQAPSLAEGKVVDFNNVTRDIVALNQMADRRVTPVLRAGLTPGTVDIDLDVKDTMPLHGSVELNNRYSPSTSHLRLNGSVSYSNLWQLGHTAGFSFQLAPDHMADAEVFSGYYIAKVPDVNWLSLMVQGTKQNSDVSTLASSDISGRGDVIGMRAIITLPTDRIKLPAGQGFYHSLSLGLDYKHFTNGVELGGSKILTPTTYYPISAAYSATWTGKGYETDLNTNVSFTIRGLGSDLTELDNSRFNADGGYILLHGDLSHWHDLPGGAQIYGKVQGQVANEPLLSSEQIAGGGLGTVRGYLESEVLGDNGIFGSVELRSPSLAMFIKQMDEWRVYVFTDWGTVIVIDPLPQQQARFNIASVGVGSRIRIFNHLNGSVDVGFPMIGATNSKAWNPLLTFRVWADF